MAPDRGAPINKTPKDLRGFSTQRAAKGAQRSVRLWSILGQAANQCAVPSAMQKTLKARSFVPIAGRRLGLAVRRVERTVRSASDSAATAAPNSPSMAAKLRRQPRRAPLAGFKPQSRQPPLLWQARVSAAI